MSENDPLAQTLKSLGIHLSGVMNSDQIWWQSGRLGEQACRVAYGSGPLAIVFAASPDAAGECIGQPLTIFAGLYDGFAAFTGRPPSEATSEADGRFLQAARACDAVGKVDRRVSRCVIDHLEAGLNYAALTETNMREVIDTYVRRNPVNAERRFGRPRVVTPDEKLDLDPLEAELDRLGATGGRYDPAADGSTIIVVRKGAFPNEAAFAGLLGDDFHSPAGLSIDEFWHGAFALGLGMPPPCGMVYFEPALQIIQTGSATDAIACVSYAAGRAAGLSDSFASFFMMPAADAEPIDTATIMLSRECLASGDDDPQCIIDGVVPGFR